MMKKMIVLMICMLIFSLIFFLNKSKENYGDIKDNKYYITLKGDDVVVIYDDEKYVERGFIAKDINGNNVSYMVNIDSNIIDNEIGIYEIKYYINEESVVRRKVYIVGNKNKDNNIIEKYDSKTLKYTVEKHENYVIAHIWVLDAYNQFKIGNTPTYQKLEKAIKILDNEIKKNDYIDKGMYIINASGFVNYTFDREFYEVIREWENTSVTPIIINDNRVIRDFTGLKMIDSPYYVYGLKRDGYFGYYKFEDGSNIELNTIIKNQIINDGVRYTFGFAPIIIDNYKIVDTSDDKDIRQAICQVDLNNFIIISNTSNNRNLGFSMEELGEYFASEKCFYAFNLDGGGSNNNYYKFNNDEIYGINISSREISDILYFVEE